MDDMLENIFGVGIPTLIEINSRTKQQPNLAALPHLVLTTFKQMLIDNYHFNRVLILQYFDYYCVAMLWFRIISLKCKKFQEGPLPHERDLLALINGVRFNIPQPILFYLQFLGKATCLSGAHVFPNFPPMPQKTIGDLGGFYGVIDEETDVDGTIRNQYEEIPCMGVVAEGVQVALSDEEAGYWYPTRIVTETRNCNRNLLHYRKLGHRSEEAKNLAMSCHITENQFPSTVPDTAINLPFLRAISDILAKTTTFTITAVNFHELPKEGSPAQLLISHPINDDDSESINVESFIRVMSLARESNESFGAAHAFNYQLMKENRPNGTTTSWCCLEPTEEKPTPLLWITNRNARRTIPKEYLVQVFSSGSKDANEVRANIVRSLVVVRRYDTLTKRYSMI